MAEKIIRVYNGIKYKDITYNEIEDANGNPTGRYTTIKEEEVTVLGTYLDIKENYDQLKQDVEALSKEDYYVNYIGLFTDQKERYFLLSRSLRSTAVVPEVNTWFEWVILILQQLGYVNDAYTVQSNPKSIEFIITPKDGSTKFKMYLQPMDEYSYKLSS